jgi:hypothetical protein
LQDYVELVSPQIEFDFYRRPIGNWLSGFRRRLEA